MAEDRTAATASLRESLIVVALKTDQANIQRRLTTILAATEPTVVDSEAHVWAKPVDDLVAADLDALAAVVGWDAVSRLRVGRRGGGRLPTSLRSRWLPTSLRSRWTRL